MLIRNATETDLPAIVAIYNASIPSRCATADLAPVTVKSKLSWFRNRDVTQRPVWVVEQENEIVAWLSFQSFYGRPAYQATAEISIYVASAYQRRGLGKTLLQKAIAESPQLNIKTLLAFIFAHNPASLILFNRYQFKQWGYLPQVASIDGLDRDLVILGRHVN